MCGIFAVARLQKNNAAELGYLGLFALQHRGQESAGLSVLNADGIMTTHKNLGLVSDVFSQTEIKSMKGNHAIGHVRYSTAGGNTKANMQPIVGHFFSKKNDFNDKANVTKLTSETISIVHNGNLTNEPQLRDELQSSGCVLQGNADTELILHLISKSTAPSLTDKIKYTLQRLEGAFSLLILTDNYLFAAVDKFAYRPLCMGKILASEELNSDGIVFASESCAFDLVGACFERSVSPGELMQINLSNGEIESYNIEHSGIKQINTTEKIFHCSFEHIYFARPDSELWGQTAQDVRFEIGKKLADECETEISNYDIVVPIPDSGIPMAMGFAKQSGLQFVTGLIRNHYVGRTFIEPSQDARMFRVKLKLNPVKSAIAGKRIVLIDDSIVRGTTSKIIVALLKEAGAKEVHLKIGSPPVTNPCYYGIDTPKRKDLIASVYSENEDFLMRTSAALGSSSLQYLSKDALKAVLNKNSQNAENNYCLSCFQGCYQDAFAQNQEAIS
jgi:amidophosphoribosyltransferase